MEAQGIEGAQGPAMESQPETIMAQLSPELTQEIMVENMKIEMGALGTMFQHMNSHCFNECIGKIKDIALTIPEACCVDRCVQKYYESYTVSKSRMMRFNESQQAQEDMKLQMASKLRGWGVM